MPTDRWMPWRAYRSPHRYPPRLAHPGSPQPRRRGLGLTPYPTIARPQRLVAWGWRPGDVQLASDEDWQREVMSAQLHYLLNRRLEAQALLGKTAADLTRTMQEVGAAWGRAFARIAPAMSRIGRAVSEAEDEADREHRRRRRLRW